MAVAADEGCSWFCESLEMNLVAYSIAGPTVMDSDLAGDGLQVKVVIVILWAKLGHVVIDVAY